MRGALWIIFVTWAGYSPSVDACRPLEPGINKRRVIPSDGMVGVPRNVQISIAYEFIASAGTPLVLEQAQPKLVEEQSGKEIEVTIHRTSLASFSFGRWFFLLKPKTPLAANTTYEIHSRLQQLPCVVFAHFEDQQKCALSPHARIARFTTGSEEDTKAPAPVTDAELLCGGVETCDSDGCCGPYRRRFFSLSWSPASAGPNSALRYNVYSGNLERLILPMVAETKVYGYYGTVGYSAPPYYVALLYGGSYVIRAVDLAGNEEQNITVIQRPEASCTLKTPSTGEGERDVSEHHEPIADVFEAPDIDGGFGTSAPSDCFAGSCSWKATVDGGPAYGDFPTASPGLHNRLGCQAATGNSAGNFLWLGLLCLPLAFFARTQRGAKCR